MANDFFVVRRGATAVPNQLVHNKDLSYAALALLVVSLSMPPGARVGYRDLVGRGLGEKVTRQALKELETLNYRFRFTHCRQGQRRDLTIVSDVPISPEDAFVEAQRMMLAGGFIESQIVACPSHPDFVIEGKTPSHTVRHTLPHGGNADVENGDSAAIKPVENQLSTGSHRAATGAARWNQDFDKENQGQSDDVTVPRSTVARWSTAQVSKDTFKESSLRSDSLPHQPTTSALTVVPDETVVGGEDATTISDVAPAGPSSPPNWQLIARAIPTTHRKGLMGKAAHRVSEALDTLVAQGWTPRRINERLTDNPLPPAVRNPPGLLISRLEALKEIPAPQHPVGPSRHSDDSPHGLPVSNPHERAQTLKARDEALAAFKEKYSTQRTRS